MQPGPTGEVATRDQSLPVLSGMLRFHGPKISSSLAIWPKVVQCILDHMSRTVLTCSLAALLVSCGAPSAEESTSEEAMPAPIEHSPSLGIEIQGHRGARGLLPENTIPGFVLAIREGADVLEMDLCISGDDQVVVSHEPWMSHEMCTTPSGELITKADERQHNLRAMSAAEIRQYDCGLRPHPRFLDQRQLPAYKPTLADVVKIAETVPKLQGTAPIRYNLEIKYSPELEPEFCPDPERFTALVLAEVQRLGITERTCIQSFSAPVMEEVHRQSPAMTTAWLVESEAPVTEQLARLSFAPDIYSPYWKLLTADDVHLLQSQGLRVIPWTVNATEELFAVMQLGVDGIITDYPDRLYAMRKQ